MNNPTPASRIKGWLIKAVVLVVAAVVLAIVVFATTGSPSPIPKPVAITSAPARDNTLTSSVVPTTVPKAQQLAVTSQIVKKVDGKYRYFFDIRNKDTQPFSGTVKIKLLTANGNVVGDEAFDIKQPITTGLGTSVYLDAYTAPAAIHGEAGVTKFSYEALVNGVVVNKGEGAISAKLEAL